MHGIKIILIFCIVEKGECIPKVLNVKTNQFLNINYNNIRDANHTDDIKFVLWLDSVNSNSMFCSYSIDGSLMIWLLGDNNSFNKYFIIKNIAEITSIEWNPIKKYLALSCLNNVNIIDLSLEELNTYTCITLQKHLRIASIAWSPDGRHIALYNKKIEKSSKSKLGNLVSIWNTENPNSVICVAVLDSLYQKVCYENNKITGYGGRGTGQARRRKTESCTETYYSSDFISWSPDGKYITYNNNYEKSLIIFELVKNNNSYSTKNDKAFKCNFKNITSIIFDSLSENIICSSKDGKLQICNINSSDVKLYKTINRPINQIQISSNGKYLAVASNTLDVLDYINDSSYKK